MERVKDKLNQKQRQKASLKIKNIFTTILLIFLFKSVNIFLMCVASFVSWKV